MLAEEDMHIFIIDPNNLKYSIKLLEYKMRMRRRTNKEYWLVDISALGTIQILRNQKAWVGEGVGQMITQ